MPLAGVKRPHQPHPPPSYFTPFREREVEKGDGKNLGSTGGTFTACLATKLWEVETGKNVLSFRHTNFVMSVAFSADGRRVLTGGGDGTAKLWDAVGRTEPVCLAACDPALVARKAAKKRVAGRPPTK